MPLLPFALAVALAAAPVLASGTPAVIAPGCDVTDATLDWGFKESFRAYIDGSIANGEWTTSDGAGYDTPVFTWSGGTGRFDPETGEGFVAFSGSVRFTGHDGLLDTTIADPYVRFDGDSGAVLLNVAGATMDGDLVEQDGVEFVALPSVDVVGDDAVRSVDAATELTAQGAIAFPNYPEGEAFDPVAISMTVGKLCAVADGGTGDVVQPGVSPLMVGLITAGALAVAGAVTGVVVATRRRHA